MATSIRRVTRQEPEWIKFATATEQPVVIVEGERWCMRCGETMFTGDTCPRCNGVAWIDPREILRPGEFVVS